MLPPADIIDRRSLDEALHRPPNLVLRGKSCLDPNMTKSSPVAASDERDRRRRAAQDEPGSYGVRQGTSRAFFSSGDKHANKAAA